MVNNPDTTWTSTDAVTLRDPLATIEASLEDFDLQLEPLVTAAESLRVTALAACEASQDHVARCARLLAQVLDVVIWSSEGKQRTDFPGAAEIARFVHDAADTLRSALEDQPGAREQIELLTDSATRRWGEWIELLDDQDATETSDVWSDGTSSEAAGDEDAHASEAVAMDRIPTAEELAHLLAAIAHGEQLADSDTPSAPPSTSEPAPRPLPGLPVPQSVDIEPELLEAYLDDAGRCLASLEAATLTLEQDPRHRPSLKQVCRELHTMKGASASVGLSDLANYLHTIEDSVQQAYDTGQGPIQVGDILASVDVLRELFTQLGAHAAVGRPDSPSTTPMATQLQDGAVDPAETIRVKASQLDRLMDMLAELVMLRNRRESQVAELQAANDELLRCSTALRVESDGLQPAGAVRERPPLNEMAADFLEIARHQREICQRITEENQVVSGFIRNFRQELTNLQRLPVAGLFQRLQRAVRDAANREGKRVRLQMLGEHAGLERSVQERLYDPLMHLVRNAVSHGIEPEAARVAAGKDPIGTIELEALGGSNLLVLEIRDDGKGLDYDAIRRRGIERRLIAPQQPTSREQLAQLIFHPGFSTKTESSAVSGRGIGMDVVAEALNRMNSWVEVESTPNQGTRIRLSIPLRSVIEPTMVFRGEGQLLAVPMQVVHHAGEASSANHRFGAPADDLPKVAIHQLLLTDPAAESELASLKRLVIGYGRQVLADSQFGTTPEADPTARQRRFELLVDEIIGPEEVVVRPLPPLLRHQSLFSGLTLSGRGEVVLLFDSRQLIERGLRHVHAAPTVTARPTAEQAACTWGKRVLVADDSISARRSLARLLRQHGLDVTEVTDGQEAMEQLRANDFLAVFSDLEMPRVGGFELLRDVATTRAPGSLPVVIVSSRSEDTFQAQARQLGATDFLLKPVLGSQIAEVLQRLGLVHNFQGEGDKR